jgi:tetratricopeptide (TPR) repeat protein
MRNLRFVLSAALPAAILIGTALADQNPAQNPNRPPLGTNPNPITWGGKPAQPPATKPAAPQGVNNTSGGTVYPYPNGSYIYDPSYGGYQYYPNGYSPVYQYPPVYAPPDEMYGPQATQRTLGIDNQSRSKSNVAGSSLRRDDEAAEPKKESERGTGAQSTALAWKYIGYGDARFAEQKYADANERYRTAARTAPQLADALFRQGFALLAMGHYDQAVAVIKRGLKLDPHWAKSDFELKTLYGEDEARKKEAHREALATILENKPNDPDLLFLLGIHLYFDGQAERADKFFQTVQKLAPEEAKHLKGFLAEP